MFWKKATEIQEKKRYYIQKFTDDKLAYNKIHYSFSTPDYYAFYTYYEDQMLTKAQYVGILNAYLKGFVKVWLANIHYSVHPKTYIGKLSICKVICKRFCPITTYDRHIQTQYKTKVKRNISLKFIMSGGLRFCVKWFKSGRMAYFPNKLYYKGKAVRAFDRALLNLI